MRAQRKSANPFYATGFFQYSLKPEGFWCFSGYRKSAVD